MKHFFIKGIKYIYRETVLHYIAYFSAYFPFFPTLMVTKIRRKLWKIMGVNIGKNVFIGYGIYLDVSSLKRLKVGDNAVIAAETLILLHKRDISKYYRGVMQHDLPMKECFINIEDNASIGMRSIILPGVTVGRGAVIGANSMVTKDVPSYSVAVGSPVRVVSKIPLEK